MTDYEIDRWADPSDFSIYPPDHDEVDRIEFLDFDVEEIKVVPDRDETVSAGIMNQRKNATKNAFDLGNVKTTMTFGEVRVVRLWSDGEPIETIGLVENESGS